MELFCEKYREKVPAATAFCRRSGEYCKFRAACLIHFRDQERRREERAAAETRPAGSDHRPAADRGAGHE